MVDPKPFELNRIFEGSLQVLRNEAEYFSRSTDHAPELGRLNESHLVKLLRAYLPPKIGVGTGFIVSGGENPRQSPQCDLVLYDSLNSAAFYKSETWSIYPIEMVYGVIEVKTMMNGRTLRDAFEKCVKIRRMAKTENGNGNKAYLRQIWPARVVSYERHKDGLSPRFFVFGYRGWKKGADLKTNFTGVTLESDEAHIHGACYLYDEGSRYIRHLAYKEGEDRISEVKENGFRAFLMELPRTLNSMLPEHRVGLGFDLIDIEHYGM